MVTYLDIAKKDLTYAESNYDIGNYSVASVYAQQSTEKSFKHIIQEYMWDFELKDILKSHSIQSLYTFTKELLPNLKESTFVLKSMTNSYFDTRYPSLYYSESAEFEAREYIQVAKRVMLAVDTYVSEHADKHTQEF